MKRKISKIIIHCSATPPKMDVDAKRIDEWHKEKGGQVLATIFLLKEMVK